MCRIVTQMEILKQFVSPFGLEWLSSSDVRKELSFGENCVVKVTPMSSRCAAINFIAPQYKSIRKNGSLGYRQVVSQPTYCSPCSWHFRQKQTFYCEGAKQNMWCNVCQHPLWSSCWEPWHKDKRLKTAEPSNRTIAELKRHYNSGTRQQQTEEARLGVKHVAVVCTVVSRAMCDICDVRECL